MGKEIRNIPCDPAYRGLKEYLSETGAKRLFLVCGPSAGRLAIGDFFRKMEEEGEIQVLRFMDFTPNPDISAALAGIRRAKEADCDMLIAIGGGSPIDVAKCIYLFYYSDHSDPGADVLTVERKPADFPFLVIPTTAGSGSEATRFAVVYRDGNKLSITDENILPDAVLLDPGTLRHLPEYQKKATLLDALCHGVESYWSAGSTGESQGYAAEAIRLILEHTADYLRGEESSLEPMMRASHLAGQAINIARTTAGHAMCYKLTTNYGCAHGHAAALCVDALWPYMLRHLGDCADPRGEAYLTKTLCALSRIVAGDEAAGIEAGAAIFHSFLYETLAMTAPDIGSEEEIRALAAAVNTERLKNHPVRLTVESLEGLYRTIAGKGASHAG